MQFKCKFVGVYTYTYHVYIRTHRKKAKKVPRSLYQQVRHAIDSPKVARLGQSKRAAKKSGTYRTTDVYSKSMRSGLLSTARGLSDYIRQTEGRNEFLRDVTQEQVQAYVTHKIEKGDWRTQRTVGRKIDELHKIDAIGREVYGYTRDREWTLRDTTERGRLPEKVRDHAMKRSHIELLKERFREDKGRSRGAAIAVELTDRCGLRQAEAAGLKREDIDLQKWQLHLRHGVKNGRHRDVPIREKDRHFFAQLHARTPERSTVCGIRPRAIAKAIDSAMRSIKLPEGQTLRDLYTKTQLHAIRKTYARERYVEERAKGKTDKAAWDTVLHELGHGDDRKDLREVYLEEGAEG